MRDTPVDRLVFADEVLTDEFGESGIVGEAVVHCLFPVSLTYSGHYNGRETPETHLRSESGDTRYGYVSDSQPMPTDGQSTLG